MKDAYERTRLEITVFLTEDVIATSSLSKLKEEDELDEKMY